MAKVAAVLRPPPPGTADHNQSHDEIRSREADPGRASQPRSPVGEATIADGDTPRTVVAMTTKPQTQPALTITFEVGPPLEINLPQAMWPSIEVLHNWDGRCWVLCVEAVAWPITLPGLEALAPLETYRLHMLSYDESGQLVGKGLVRSLSDTQGWRSLDVPEEVLEVGRQLLADVEPPRPRTAP